MADEIDYAAPKHPSTKPTNLDEQIEDAPKTSTNHELTPPVIHEDATPDEEGGNLDNGVAQENELSEETLTLSRENTSASELGMSTLSTVNQTSSVENQSDGHIKPSSSYEGTNESQATSTSSVSNGECVRDVDSGVSLSSSQSKPKVTHDWIDVLGNGNLLKKVLREGEGVSTRPMAQAQVRMKVRGSLSTGGVVDRHSSLEFIVGDGDVIQALDIIAPLMEKGETCQIKTDHRYAYGAVGRSPDIPPKSALMYDVELLDVKGPLDFTAITESKLLHHLNKKRGRGNDLFQRKEYSLAVHSYSRAVNMMARYKEEQSLPEFSPEISDLWVRCLNNLAAAQLKVEMYNEALDSVNKVLDTDPDNVKALYRCGKVFMVKGDYGQAVDHLQRASKLNPDEKAIKAELQKATRLRDQSLEQEKALYKRMMTGTNRSGASSRQNSPNPAGSLSRGARSGPSWNWRHFLFGAGLVAITALGIGYLKYRK